MFGLLDVLDIPRCTLVGNTLGTSGIPFKAGEIILSGSLVPLVPVQAGDRFELDIDGLGSTRVSFRA